MITTVYAYAGTNSGYNEEIANARQSVFVITPAEVEETDKDAEDNKNDDYESDYMVSCELKEDTVYVDEYAYITVVATNDVEKVKVTNSFGSTRAEVSTYTEDDDERTFEIKTRMTKKGSGELYVELYLEDSGYEDCSETLKITVKDEDDEEYDELEIVDVELMDDVNYKGEEATVIVYTSTDVVEVALYDENDDLVERSLYDSGKVDGMLMWYITFEVEHSGKEKYTVKAFNEDDDEDSETIRIEGETYSKNDLVVLGVTQKTNNVEEGDICKFEARTTSSADYIIVTTDGGTELENVTKSSGSSTKKFTFSLEIDDVDDEYYVYAYSDDGETANKKFKVIAQAVEEVEIISYEIVDKTVEEGDDIELTIYTTTNVEKLWIEDEEGERVAKKSNPTEKNDDEYIWEVDFEAFEEGKVVYTIYVEDEDDNTDEYDFRVTVTE